MTGLPKSKKGNWVCWQIVELVTKDKRFGFLCVWCMDSDDRSLFHVASWATRQHGKHVFGAWHKHFKSHQWTSSAGTTALISKPGIVLDSFFDLGIWAECFECKPSTPPPHAGQDLQQHFSMHELSGCPICPFSSHFYQSNSKPSLTLRSLRTVFALGTRPRARRPGKLRSVE